MAIEDEAQVNTRITYVSPEDFLLLQELAARPAAPSPVLVRAMHEVRPRRNFQLLFVVLVLSVCVGIWFTEVL